MSDHDDDNDNDDNGGQSNVDQLATAGLVDPHAITAETADAIESLSEDEVECLINAAEKLGVPSDEPVAGVVL